jgi:hypothetical protein
MVSLLTLQIYQCMCSCETNYQVSCCLVAFNSVHGPPYPDLVNHSTMQAEALARSDQGFITTECCMQNEVSLSHPQLLLFLKSFVYRAIFVVTVKIYLALMACQGIPIVVGVGDIKNRSVKVEDAIEPAELMLQAILESISDTSLSPEASKQVQSKIDSVSVVNTWTWNYSDLPSLISEKLGVIPKHKVLSHHGGDSPAKLFDAAARRISCGESKVAVVCGGEALASCMYFDLLVTSGYLLTWSASGCLCCCWQAASSWMDRTG